MAVVPASEFITTSDWTDADPGLNLSEILSVIRRRIWVPLVGVLLSSCLTYAYLIQVNPEYTADAMILIEGQNQNFVPIEFMVAGLSGDAETVQSEGYVLSSRGLASRVIEKLNLIADPEFNPASQEGYAGPDTSEFTGSILLENFLERLQVLPVEASRVISVSFTSVDPVKAANIVNTLVDEYISSGVEAKFESIRRADSWVDERVNELQIQVGANESAISAARQQYGLLESGGVTLASQELAQLNTQLINARADRTETEARLIQIESLIDSPAGIDTAMEVLDSPLIQRLKEQQTALARQIAELSTEYGQLHPRMVQLFAEKRDLEENVNSEINKIVIGLRNQVNAAEARVHSLSNDLDELTARVGDSNKNEIEVRALEREAEANRLLLGTLLARQKEILSQQDENFQQADARVLSRASIPQDQSFPQTNMILGLVFLASGLLGFLLILVLELLDRGFNSGEQLEQATGMTSLGIIPKTPARTLSPVQTVLQNPRTAYGESIRTLNWSISLGYGGDAPPKVILVTSSSSGEGKSTVAASLALSQAMAYRKVLLIDADTRSPSIHTLLEHRRGPGLTDLLLDLASTEEVVLSHPQSGLDVLPAGLPVPNPSGLFGSPQMDTMLDGFRSCYDLIIIDCPPVMACSDARVLSRCVDTTVMVVRFAKTRQEVVMMCVKQLVSAGANLAGVLLTIVNLKKYSTYYYGDSGAYSGKLVKYYGG